MSRGGTGGGKGIGGAVHAELHGNMAGASVAHSQRNGEWMDAMPAMVEEFPITDFVGESATHAGAGDDGGVIAEFLCPFDAGTGHGFAGSNDRKLGEAIHEAGALRGK